VLKELFADLRVLLLATFIIALTLFNTALVLLLLNAQLLLTLQLCLVVEVPFDIRGALIPARSLDHSLGAAPEAWYIVELRLTLAEGHGRAVHLWW
jgi:Na+/H+ antiporter NhaB